MIFFNSREFIIIILFSFFSTFLGCQENIVEEDPVTYNDKLSRELSDVRRELYLFFDLLPANNEKELEEQRQRAHAQIKKSLSLVQSMPPINKDATYRNITNDVLSFYEESVRKFYPEIIQLSIKQEPTEEENERIELIFEVLEDAAEPLEEKLTATRQKFAKEYGLVYENTKDD